MFQSSGRGSRASFQGETELPPLKWSSMKYDFWLEDEIDGKEEAYGGRDRCEASAG